jgi:hypothetical protein
LTRSMPIHSSRMTFSGAAGAITWISATIHPVIGGQNRSCRPVTASAMPAST